MGSYEVSSLAADNHPVIMALFWSAGAIYLLCGLMVLKRPAQARGMLWAGVAAHFAATAARGMVIEFFPLTNKFESFSAASLGVALVLALAWRPSRIYVLAVLAVVIAYLAVALSFPHDMVYPPPLMRTLWYPLHVPLSFLAYGTWAVAAASALVWLVRRERVWLSHIDHMALLGFGLWSLSMIFGGFWGVVAWGAYFMWDPKIIWSVILWFHYASFIHLRLTPSLNKRDWVRPVFAVVGFALVFIAYIGTSFFFGKSSHAFS